MAHLTEIPAGLSLITGPRGAGKTAWCAALIAQARRSRLSGGGVLCPAKFEDGVKTGIFLEHIQTGEQRLLGSLYPAPAFSQPVGRWHFDPAALQWGNTILQHTAGVDVTIIDELGPLEFKEAGGWLAGLALVDEGRYRSACVVIRPDLLAQALQRWPTARVIEIPAGEA